MKTQVSFTSDVVSSLRVKKIVTAKNHERSLVVDVSGYQRIGRIDPHWGKVRETQPYKETTRLFEKRDGSWSNGQLTVTFDSRGRVSSMALDGWKGEMAAGIRPAPKGSRAVDPRFMEVWGRTLRSVKGSTTTSVKIREHHFSQGAEWISARVTKENNGIGPRDVSTRTVRFTRSKSAAHVWYGENGETLQLQRRGDKLNMTLKD